MLDLTAYENFITENNISDNGLALSVLDFLLFSLKKELIEYAISVVKDDVTETFGNTNGNGNALYEVVKQWAEQRK